MNKAQAQTALGHIRTVTAELDTISQLALGIADQVEQERLIRNVGEVLVFLNERLLQPIVAEHPDLDPYRDFK